MLSKNDVLGADDNLDVGSKVSGRYNSKLLPATLIHIGSKYYNPDNTRPSLQAYSLSPTNNNFGFQFDFYLL